jgi:hypothetical protein
MFSALLPTSDVIRQRSSWVRLPHGRSVTPLREKRCDRSIRLRVVSFELARFRAVGQKASLGTPQAGARPMTRRPRGPRAADAPLRRPKPHGACSCRSAPRPIFRNGGISATGRPRNIGASTVASGCRMIGALVSDRGRSRPFDEPDPTAGRWRASNAPRRRALCRRATSRHVRTRGMANGDGNPAIGG